MASIKTESADKMATRDGFGRGLTEVANKYDFYVLSADLCDSTRTIYFRDAYPNRFIECGIAEANMVDVAVGIATTGTHAVVSTYAMFAAGRAFEQIRNSVCYPHLNVVIGATHGGLSVGEDGATHQCIEDIALMRALPGMTVISPCDGLEAKKAVDAALAHQGPVYIRLGRSASQVITKPDSPFTLGKAVELRDGKDAVIFATGILVNEALQARELLLQEGIEVAVVNVHTIKPLDEQTVVKYAQKTKRVFTVEEHSVIGGLGGAVAECLGKLCPTKIDMIGVNDQFGQSGSVNDLLDYYKLTAPHIAQFIKENI